MGCPELHTIEGSIFPEATITSMKQVFYNCPKLVNIPADLFKPFGEAKLKFTKAEALKYIEAWVHYQQWHVVVKIDTSKKMLKNSFQKCIALLLQCI